ncbi:sulfur carrier protein ThiS [bacterium]|nr:MAG: sulfur carrier protein ThiS [bacterium]
MEITINGSKMETGGEQNLSSLLKGLGVDPEKTVAELNGEVIPKSAYGQTIVRGGDKIELIRFVGGG